MQLQRRTFLRGSSLLLRSQSDMEDGPSSTSCFRRLTDCFPGASRSSFFYKHCKRVKQKNKTEIDAKYKKLCLSVTVPKHFGRAGVLYLPMRLPNFMNDSLRADLDGWGLHSRGTRQDCNTENVACVSSVLSDKIKSGFMNPISNMSWSGLPRRGQSIRHGTKKRSEVFSSRRSVNAVQPTP